MVRQNWVQPKLWTDEGHMQNWKARLASGAGQGDGWASRTDGREGTHTHKLNHVKKKVKNTQRNTDTLWMHI